MSLILFLRESNLFEVSNIDFVFYIYAKLFYTLNNLNEKSTIFYSCSTHFFILRYE